MMGRSVMPWSRECSDSTLAPENITNSSGGCSAVGLSSWAPSIVDSATSVASVEARGASLPPVFTASESSPPLVLDAYLAWLNVTCGSLCVGLTAARLEVANEPAVSVYVLHVATGMRQEGTTLKCQQYLGTRSIAALGNALWALVAGNVQAVRLAYCDVPDPASPCHLVSWSSSHNLFVQPRMRSGFQKCRKPSIVAHIAQLKRSAAAPESLSHLRSLRCKRWTMAHRTIGVLAWCDAMFQAETTSLDSESPFATTWHRVPGTTTDVSTQRARQSLVIYASG